MASFKAKFPVLQELFAKNHRGPLAPPPPAARGLIKQKQKQKLGKSMYKIVQNKKTTIHPFRSPEMFYIEITFQM